LQFHARADLWQARLLKNHIALKQLVSTKVKGFNTSANFLIGNRFHATLRILSPTILFK